MTEQANGQRRAWGCVFRKRNSYYIKFTHKGQLVKRRAGATQKEAEEKLDLAEALAKAGLTADEILERLFPADDRQGPATTFARSVNSYLAYAERKLKPTTLTHRGAALRRIAKAPWAKKPLRSIQTTDLNKWIHRRYRNGQGRNGGPISTCAVNRDLAAVGALFHWACGVGLCERNPARGDAVDRRSEKAHAREIWWNADEMSYLFGVASDVAPDLEPLLRLACFTGMRRGELRQARLRQIDHKERTLTVPKEHSKNGKPRTFRLTQAAYDAILTLNPFRGDPAAHLLVTDRGDPWTDNSIKNRWSKIRAAAGDADKLPAEKAGDQLRLHDARHTFATHLASAGVRLHLLADMLGQSSVWVTERYAHCCPDAVLKAVDAVRDVFTGANDQDAADAAEA